VTFAVWSCQHEGAMQIATQKAVTIEYTLKEGGGDGQVLDTSEGRPPLTYLHGVGALVPGLEKALEGKGVGDAVEVTLTPQEGYGDRDERLIRNLPLRKLRERDASVGQRVPADVDGRPRLVLITALRGDYATVDANHPLAGKTLHFAVKVVEVRDATAEELAHGHVHGPGGHH
jgi:FKBP-type peptidyl-prolyl cis-trans isomerase SlyD